MCITQSGDLKLNYLELTPGSESISQWISIGQIGWMSRTSLLVQAHEGIRVHNTLGLVLRQKGPCVVPAQAIGGLREVVGAKALWRQMG